MPKPNPLGKLADLLGATSRPAGTQRFSDAYARHKARTGKRQHDQAAAGRDIGDIPAVANPERRQAASASLETFCRTYFPLTFNLPFCTDQQEAIRDMERAVKEGGTFALAMPRGSGKTSFSESACMFAVLYGHRRFVVLIGATAELAGKGLLSIKREIETNELLHADFPEVCWPVQKLERIGQRAKGQTLHGLPTYITWGNGEVVLPTVPGSKASGAMLRCAGLTSSIRGMRHKLPTGESLRPDLAVVDDPQTRDSARSVSQCATREAIVTGDVLGLAGPGKKIAGILLCTVIRQSDLADCALDRKKHPEWNGRRTKMVYDWPVAEKLWDQYAELRREGMRQGDGGKGATDFYREHREEMDAGSRIAWAERFNHDELSALQHAVNLRIDHGDAVFFAEYQNQPLPEATDERVELTTDEVMAKVNRCKRGLVPATATQLTAFVDVQKDALYWLVVAWEQDFTGAIVDCGSYPDQGRVYYTLRDIKKTLSSAAPGKGMEGSIYAGLETLCARLLGREWPGDNGNGMRIGKCLVDANWGDSTQVVYTFCRQSVHSAVLLPSHGKYIGGAGSPMEEWQKREGERRGNNWRISPSDKGIRKVIVDTNWWKSMVHARLATAMGDRGCLSLFGDRPEAHRLLAEHLTAEYRKTVAEVRPGGRKVDEWKSRLNRENHFFDCLVGAAVGASILGCGLPESGTGAPKRIVSFKQMQEEAREKRRAS